MLSFQSEQTFLANGKKQQIIQARQNLTAKKSLGSAKFETHWAKSARVFGTNKKVIFYFRNFQRFQRGFIFSVLVRWKKKMRKPILAETAHTNTDKQTKPHSQTQLVERSKFKIIPNMTIIEEKLKTLTAFSHNNKKRKSLTEINEKP